jgi:hypothetical protein
MDNIIIYILSDQPLNLVKMSAFNTVNKKNTAENTREKIYLANEVDVTKFKFGKVETNKYGGKSVRVSYNDQNYAFMLQLPRVRIPFGLGQYKDENSTTVKYSLDFALNGHDLDETGQPKNPKMRQVYEVLMGMKESLVDAAFANSREWLGLPKGKSREVVEAMVRDVLRFATDKKTGEQLTQYPPTMKAKVRFWDGKFNVKAFHGETREPLHDLETAIPKGSEAIPILRLNSVTLAGGKCGFQWEVFQIRVFPPAKIADFAFIEDDDEPIRSTVKAQPVEEKAPAKPAYTNQVEDSDEDEEEKEPVNDELDEEAAEEDEEERPPTPPPAKKVVKKVVAAPKKK